VNIACIALDFKVTVELECTSFVISYKSQNVRESLKLFGDVTVYNGVTVYGSVSVYGSVPVYGSVSDGIKQ